MYLTAPFTVVYTLSCVSTYRQDYLYAHSGAVPSLEGAASQLNTLKKEQSLRSVFLSTDAPLEGKYTHSGMLSLSLFSLRLRQEGIKEDGEWSGLVYTY